MALGATLYVFKIDLADSDRSVYQPLELRVARLAARLVRRMEFTLTVAERHAYLTLGEETLDGVIERVWIGGGAGS